MTSNNLKEIDHLQKNKAIPYVIVSWRTANGEWRMANSIFYILYSTLFFKKGKNSKCSRHSPFVVRRSPRYYNIGYIFIFLKMVDFFEDYLMSLLYKTK